MYMSVLDYINVRWKVFEQVYDRLTFFNMMGGLFLLMYNGGSLGNDMNYIY